MSKKKLKRGTKVRVNEYKGTVISHNEDEGLVQVSVKGAKPAIWTVVPRYLVQSEEEQEESERRYRRFLDEENRGQGARWR